MKRNIHHTILLTFIMSVSFSAYGQDIQPCISPTAVFTLVDGTEETSGQVSGSAPIKGHFAANPSDVGEWTATYEWRVTKEDEKEPYIIRYEEETSITFKDYGTSSIVCYATFTHNGDSIVYGEEYWESELQPFICSVASSRLEMPNAFSPNGDGINDIYKAKEGWQSIVEFKAIIFNRWGQKIYEWDDPAGGWDGRHNGRDVPDGVYYCLVKARGADGIRYSIKRDVNLLRGYTETAGGTE